MRNILILLLIATYGLSGFAQGIRPVDLVEKAKASGQQFQEMDLFSTFQAKKELENNLDKEVHRGTYNVLTLDFEKLERLLEASPEMLLLSVPSISGKSMILELVKVNIYADNFAIRDGATNDILGGPIGIFYRGIIQGDNQSTAAFSVAHNEVRGIFSNKKGNVVLGKTKNKHSNKQYILYNDKDLLSDFSFGCGIVDDGRPYTKEELSSQNLRNLGDCISLFFEADYDIYIDKGSNSFSVAFFVAFMFNEVATLYANDNITVKFSELIIWQTPSPYTEDTSSELLSQFQDYRTSFNGDLGQLLSYKAAGSGIAAGFSGLCNNNRAKSLSFSGIYSSYSTVPTYSWNIYVIAHEFGHLFGSRHTHACVWNGNNTAIDGCSGSTEGSCSIPGLPSVGGTIMSYCHFNVGINFALGFGSQPGNVIRNKIADASCLTSCSESCVEELTLTPYNFGAISGDGTMQAEVSIIASHIVKNSANLKYHAGEFLEFKSGFHAQNGTDFHAYIEDCNTNFVDDGSSNSLTESSTDIESSTRNIKDADDPAIHLRITPNPFQDQTMISFHLPHDGDVELQVFDLNGRLIIDVENYLIQGYNEVYLDDWFDVPPGIYILKLSAEGIHKTKRLIRAN